MKFFLAIALLAAAASAYVLPAGLNLTPPELAEVEQIMAAIHSPSTDPTTAVMLEQMLFEILGVSPVQTPVNIPAIIDQFEPIHVGPAIVDQFEPIHVGPAIIDQFEPIHVGPAIIDQFEPIHVGPAIVDFPVPESALAPTPVAVIPVAPAAPAPSSSPLVQIIVNVNQQSDIDAVSPVQVDHVEAPTPVIVVDQAEESIIKPTPVVVVEEAEESIIKPTPVIVVDEAWVQPEPVLVGHLPEPVNVAPIIVAPAVIAPETLN